MVSKKLHSILIFDRFLSGCLSGHKGLRSLFTVGEAVRSTCGKSHEEKEKDNNFHLSLLQTFL